VGYFVKDIILGTLLIKDTVEVEQVFLLFSRQLKFHLNLLGIGELNLAFQLSEGIASAFVCLEVVWQNGAHSDKNSDVAFEGQILVEQLLFKLWVKVVSTVDDIFLVRLQSADFCFTVIFHLSLPRNLFPDFV
jgi:hypothetical protein